MYAVHLSSSSAGDKLKQEHHFCCHFQSDSSLSVTKAMATNNESATNGGAFTCFNVNCYATFRTERGLKQHLWRSVSCGTYMSEPRPVLAASVGILHESTWRRRLGYGVESLRVNRFMNADPPSYEPYEVFEYSENFDHAEDDGIDDEAELNNNPLVSIDDVAISCPVFHAMMERILSSERHAIMVLRHDVEHRNTGRELFLFTQ